ncbi:uncharacterized protein LOC104417622 [Eucalyptus grandis]|uniref:uncharacterized protein LOC104417622 n=1 Tax=Eucalyptus grandis TaxID=71139 RepID=UPI00052768B6|nr:uncharacterized protein LOC104417622 [Eucalyptus grandis]
MANQVIDKVLPFVVTEEELEPGSHIFVRRCNGLYTHHGIYVGEGTVIHFTRTRGVDRTCLDCFRREGEKLHSLRSLPTGWGNCKKSAREVVNKARDLHEGGGFGEYHLFNNNCEHFATFCRTGVRKSAQTASICACARKIKKVQVWALKLLGKSRSNDPKIRGDSGIESKNLIVEQA